MTVKTKCGNCKHWISFMDAYEDEFEPYDKGFCEHLPNSEKITSIDDYCNNHEEL
ncbi:MAG: hypothetical protein AB7G52_15085 [Arcobacter sp.]